MSVTKIVYTNFATLEGTLAEVIESLSDNNIPDSKIMSIYYDQGNSRHVAVYKI